MRITNDEVETEVIKRLKGREEVSSDGSVNNQSEIAKQPSSLQHLGSQLDGRSQDAINQNVQRRLKEREAQSQIEPYTDIYQFWYDCFNFVRLLEESATFIWGKNTSPVWDTEKKAKHAILSSTALKITRERIAKRCEVSKIPIPYHVFVKQVKIPPMVDRVLLYLFFAHLTGQLISGEVVIHDVCLSMEDVFALHQQMESYSGYLQHIIRCDLTMMGTDGDSTESNMLDPLTRMSLMGSFREIVLGTKIDNKKDVNIHLQQYLMKLKRLRNSPPEQERQSSQSTSKDENGKFWQSITPVKTIDQLIFSENDNLQINELLSYLDPKTREKLASWGQLKDNNSVIMLINGDSGTGKSALAEAIAYHHEAKLFRVDSSSIINKYVGDTEKATRQIFIDYRAAISANKGNKNHLPKVLLWFDEADQIFSRRITISHSTDATHNRMQNILLEELTRFSGILIATANNLQNLDDAFARRFNFKIKISFPDIPTRQLIWKYYLVKQIPLAEDVNIFDLSSYELTGAQIESAVQKTCIRAAAKNQKMITMQDFVGVVTQEMKSATGIKKPGVVGFK